jgi:hypothetical protein
MEKEISTDKVSSTKSLKKAKNLLFVRLIDNSAEAKVLNLSNAATSLQVRPAQSQHVVEYIANPARAAYLCRISPVCKVEKRAVTLLAPARYAVQGLQTGFEYPCGKEAQVPAVGRYRRLATTYRTPGRLS